MNVCIYRVRHLTFFQLVLILWMVTLTSYLIWQIISFILPPNEYGCVYAWPSGPAIDLRNMPILTKKNHLFRWSSFRSWRVCKQAKLSHLRHRKPVRIDWKPLHPKQVIVWCGFWSRGINGPFFFENEQGEAVTVNGDRYRALLNELLFTKIEEEDIGNIWFQQDVATCFAPCFWRSHYEPQSWYHLATSELRFDTIGLLFVGCRQRKVLRREARDNWGFKGQYSWSHWWLHTIVNVLKI